MDVLLWSLSILVGLLTAVIGFLSKQQWNHLKECREVRAAIAAMRSDLTRVQTDIGTHETGLRGQVHDLAGKVGPVVLWYERERK